LCGVFALVTVLFWLLSPDITVRRSKSADLKVILNRRDLWLLAGLWISCGMASMGIYNIVPLFLVDEKGLAVEVANQYFGLSRIGGFAGQIGIGFFLDRYDTKKILLLLTLFSGLAGIGLALAQGTALLVLMMLLQATFCVVFFPVGLVAIAKLTTPDERSAFTGTLMAISGVIGIGITPWILGGIADAWSFQAGILALAVFNLLVCIPGLRLPRL